MLRAPLNTLQGRMVRAARIVQRCTVEPSDAWDPRQILGGTADATRVLRRLETMGTELLIVAVTVFFYALCALFTRVCDRI